MPRKPMESLTESMFYVLLALQREPMCGMDVANYLDELTQGRLQLGPATLYTILAKYEKERYITETAVDGRKRTYQITEKGRQAYAQECERLRQCLADTEKVKE